MARFHLKNPWINFIVLLAAAYAFISLCSPWSFGEASNWPMYQHDIKRQGANTDPNDQITPDSARGLGLAWFFPTDPRRLILSEPIVVDGVVYFGSSNGTFYALNASNGSLLWRADLGISPSRSDCDPNQLGVSSTGFYEQRDGQRIIYVGGLETDPSPPQHIYVYALDAATGAILRRSESLGDPREGDYPWSSPLIANNKLYYGVGSHGDPMSPGLGGGNCPFALGKLYALRLDNLERDPSISPNPRSFNTPPLLGGGVFTTPAVDEATETLYVTTGSGQAPQGSDFRSVPTINALLALDLNTLQIRASWQLPGPLSGTFDISSGPVIFPSGLAEGQGPHKLVGVGGRNNAFYAFDADNPTNIANGPYWIQQIGDRRGKNVREGEGVTSNAAFINETLYVGGGDRCYNGGDRSCTLYAPGSVVALDPATGRIKNSFGNRFPWRHLTLRVIGALTGSNKGVLYVPSAQNSASENRFEVVDARDGSTLFQFSADDRLWSGAAAAADMVFVGSYDGFLYAFKVMRDPGPDLRRNPSGLDGKPGNETVTLNWVGHGDASSFIVQRRVLGGGFTWETIAEDVAATSYTDDQVQNATIYEYRVIGQFDDGSQSGPSNIATAIPTAGLADWSSMDISTERGGSADYLKDGSIKISAGGGDIFGPADQFHYVFRTGPNNGQSNVQITARLRQVRVTSTYTKAGVDIRAISGSDSADTGSPHMGMSYLPVPGTGLESNYRSDFYGDSSFAGHIPTNLPVCLRVRRRGRLMEAFYSVEADNCASAQNWVRVGGAVDYQDRLRAGVTVGLSVTAHDESQITQAVFDQVSINTEVPPQPPFNVRAVPEEQAVTVSWDAAPGATEYNIYRQQDRMGDFVKIASGAETPYRDKDVQAHGIYFYKVSSVNQNGEEFSNEVYVRVGPADLRGFRSRDIGTSFTGDADFSPTTNVLSVFADGSDIWANADAFRYTFKDMCGDGELSARILHLDPVDEYSKAGIMIRESELAGAANLAVLWVRDHHFRVQWRSTTGDSTADNGYDIPGDLPKYVHIVRTGFNFKAYLSQDQTSCLSEPANCILIGPAAGITIGMGTGALQGIALTSHSNGRGALARFDDIRTGPEPNPKDLPLRPGDLSVRGRNRRIEISWGSACNATSYNIYKGLSEATLELIRSQPETSYVDEDVQLDTTYYYQAEGVNSHGVGPRSNIGNGLATNLYDFDDTLDIGTGTPGTTIARSPTEFDITGSGNDIWNQADGFRYLYKEVTGNVTVVARVTSMMRTNEWAKAGVMIRETLDANSKQFSLVQAFDHGINMQYRPGTGSSSSSADDLRVGDGLTPPPQRWLRIKRLGNTFSAEWSENGDTYTPIPRTIDINMNSRVFVGLAVTAHNEGARNLSTFSHARVTTP